jgi:ribosomal-protein-alanine N-acetyltransferase
MQPSDLDDLARMYADPEVMRGSAGLARGRTREQSSLWLQHELSIAREPWHRTFRVDDRTEHTFIGRCGLRPAGGATTEIAYAFVHLAWGRGFATETARAVIDWGARMGLTRLTACALEENIASQHVLEKVGMRRTGDETTPEGHVVRYEM